MLSNDSNKTIIVLSVFAFLATSLVALRIRVRYQKKSLGIDDALLALALFILYIHVTGALLRECFLYLNHLVSDLSSSQSPSKETGARP